MTTTRPKRKTRRDIEAQEHIDTKLRELGDRKLIATTEVSDILLDLRNKFEPLPTTEN